MRKDSVCRRQAARTLAVVFVLMATTSLARAGIPWINDDLNQAFRDARVKKRPLLVYFHTTWCSWCVEFEDKVFSDDEVVYQANAFVPLRVNCDYPTGQRLARRYRVSSYPSVIAVTADNEILGRLAMFRPAPDFLRFLHESLTPAETLAAVEEKIEKGDRSPELLVRSADRHFEAAEPDVARRRYQDAIAIMGPDQKDLAVDARLGLGRVMSQLGDSAGALDQYRTVLTSYPDSKRLPEAFVAALLILRDEKGDKEIAALFKEFAGRFPDDPAVLNDHARHLLETGGDAALAVEKASRATTLSPDSADYRATLARALLAAHRPLEALDAIGRAIGLRPADKDLRMQRLEILEAVQKLSASGASGPASSKSPASHSSPEKNHVSSSPPSKP